MVDNNELVAARTEQARLRHQLLDLQTELDKVKKALRLIYDMGCYHCSDTAKEYLFPRTEAESDWRKEPMFMEALYYKENPFIESLKQKTQCLECGNRWPYSTGQCPACGVLLQTRKAKPPEP